MPTYSISGNAGGSPGLSPFFWENMHIFRTPHWPICGVFFGLCNSIFIASALLAALEV
jgi:hypothetical protein